MTIPPRDAGHQHKTLVTEFNEIVHHTTRQVHVLEKKFQNKFTQQTHFPAATFLQKYMCLRPGVILPLFFERRSLTFSLLKKKEHLITVYWFLGYLPRGRQLLCGFELMN